MSSAVSPSLRHSILATRRDGKHDFAALFSLAKYNIWDLGEKLFRSVYHVAYLSEGLLRASYKSPKYKFPAS